jgi:dimethylaniline monooxygenase (N-oxide forming)
MLVSKPSVRRSPGRAALKVAVIGAGSSGLPVVKAVRERGVAVECFERGSDVGGLWRYDSDSGLSSAYKSLRTNVSSAPMGYPSFSLPTSHGDFPHHSEMAEYLSAYAKSFRLREHVRFRTSVERLEPEQDRGRCLSLQDDAVHRFDAVVVAVGHDWCPKLPAYPGVFAGHTSHSHPRTCCRRCAVAPSRSARRSSRSPGMRPLCRCDRGAVRRDHLRDRLPAQPALSRSRADIGEW